MANETTTAKASKPELVEVFVPRGHLADEPHVPVSVNGKTWLLPKGKTSKVPTYVKWEYDRSLRAKEAMDVHAAEMAERAAEQEKNPVGA